MLTTCTPAYGDPVPNQPRTPNHSIRIGDPKWEGFDAVARAQGSDRTKWVDQIMGWMLHEPGAVLPPRPSLHEVAALLAEAAASARDHTSVEKRKRQALRAIAEQAAQALRAAEQVDSPSDD